MTRIRRSLTWAIMAWLMMTTGAHAAGWESTPSEVEAISTLTLRYETPHIKWARPYAQGTVRVLYLIDSPFEGMFTRAREAVELMQRFDIELDAAFHYRFGDGAWFGGEAGLRRLLRLMRDNHYDAYVFQDMSPKTLPMVDGVDVFALFQERVRAGAGVVLIGVEPEQQGEDADGPAPDPRHGVPAEVERFASFDARPDVPYGIGWRQAYEQWMVQLGGALLDVADRAPAVTIDIAVPGTIARSDLPGATVRFAVRGDAPADTRVELTLRGMDDSTRHFAGFESSRGEHAITLPKLPAGAYFIDAIARSGRGIEGFASTRFTVAASARIETITFDKPWAEPGERGSGSVLIAGDMTGRRVELRLIDRFGRVLDTQPLDTGDEAGVYPFAFDVEHWMPMLLRVDAAVFEDGDVLVARADASFNVTKRHREKFNFIMWDFPNTETLGPYAAETMQRHGVTAITTSRPPSDLAAAYEMTWVPMTGGLIRTGPHTEGWHSDGATNYFIGRMKEVRYHGVLAYSLGDEGPVAGAGVQEAAMNAYRDYLRGQYGDIAALNAAWGEAYDSFDEVALLVPDETNEQAAYDSGRYARWYDRQMFMTDNYAQLCIRHREQLEAFDAQSLLGFEGQVLRPRRGDPYQIVKEMDFWVPYGGPMDELLRSLTIDRPEFIRANWMGYHRSADGLTNKYWRMVFNGANSAWWWMWTTIGAWEGFLAPDLGAFDHVQAFVDDTQPMRDGLGQLLRASRMQDSGVAVLYSMPSTFAVTIEPMQTYGDYEPNHHALHTILNDLHINFRYVDARQMHNGEIDLADFKVLILAQAVALSDDDAKVIRAFVDQGGTVIADVRPGVFDGHLVARDRGVLDDVFGIAGELRQPAARAATTGDDQTLLTWDNAIIDPAVRVDGGGAMGSVGDTPVGITHSFGDGRAVLLNMAMASFPARQTAMWLRRWGDDVQTPEHVAAWFRQLLATADVEAAVKLEAYGYRRRHSTYAGNVRLQRWRNGGIDLIALHREIGTREQVRTTLDEPRHVYDLRDGLYIGEVKSWMNEVIPSRARFLALLPHRCPPPKLDLPAEAQRGTRVALQLSVPGAAGVHALKVTAAQPDGSAATFWEQVVTVTDKPVTVTLPVAHNDPTGTWRITVTDSYTTETRTTVELIVQ